MIHDLSAWRSTRKKASSEALYKEWSTMHLEELFSVLKSVEEGRGSVTVDTSGVTVSAGYGIEIVFREDGSVSLGDETCSVGEKVHFIGNKCFSLLDDQTLLRFLGLLLVSVADGVGFVEWSAGYGVLYSDTYRCWAIFSRDGRVEFNGVAQTSQH
ncbi:MAG TPA: hypothetical protein VKF36_11075 [Syntrophorhabdales bacterium]|nr:hypothetical protein [Syntrophorhabdales bacterium]